MKMEKVLWGTAKDAEDWQETIITSTRNEDHFNAAYKWAQDNGFRNLRTQVLDGELPNFAATVRR